MKHGIAVAFLIGSIAAVGARAQETNAPPAPNPPAHRPMGPMMEHLLPPRVLDELSLTPDQKTKYDVLEASFKKDAAKWRADNPPGGGSSGQAGTNRPFADRQGLRDLRKSYIDKVRAFLTDEQKAKLDKALERVRERRGGPGPGGPPPPPPSE